MKTDSLATARTLLLLPIVGMLALYVSEIAGVLMGGGDADFSALPPAAMIVVVLVVAAVPVLLLSVSAGRASLWVSLVIAALMALFHLMHAVEHVMAGDWAIFFLIVVTGLLPNAIAVLEIRKPGANAQDPQTEAG